MLILVLIGAIVLYAFLYICYTMLEPHFDSSSGLFTSILRSLTEATLMPQNTVFVIFRGLIIVTLFYILAEWMVAKVRHHQVKKRAFSKQRRSGTPQGWLHRPQNPKPKRLKGSSPKTNGVPASRAALIPARKHLFVKVRCTVPKLSECAILRGVHVVLAPDIFKGSLSAPQACAAMERGVRRASGQDSVTFSSVPLADGGEGTLDALLLSAHGWEKRARVRGPLGSSLEARWGILPDGTAVIEMAQASGLTLVDATRRDAPAAATFGTGQLIKAALDAGCREFLIGVGGSATTDGGSGALTALGAMIRDEHDVILPPGGGALSRAHALDLRFLDARLAKCHFTVLCDVTNPLCGDNGAAHVYGPQKGASPEQVALLDEGLGRWADVVAQIKGQDLRDVPGAGAAGGTSFGLMSVLDAQLAPGIERVLDAAHFDETLAQADWVLTGEGSLDQQTLAGKTVAGVCRRAQKAKGGKGVPVIAFGGTVKLSGAEMDILGLRSAFSLCDRPLSLEECVAGAATLLEFSVERVWRYLRANG